ncbi:protein BCAP [Rhea pennata]|uniref:protein BCAP n=1 Tax=Rhea pennata TaxID=8795 RepID=UPI002E25CC64
MSSSSPSLSSYLRIPAHSCTVPLLDSDVQKRLFLPDGTEGKICVPHGVCGEAAKLYSLIQPFKKDYQITTKTGQDGKYFTDLCKESDSLEHQFLVHAEEETWKQNWSLCTEHTDKHDIKFTELSPLLKEILQKNHVQHSLNESEVKRQVEENTALQEKLFEAEMAINLAEKFLPTFKDLVDRKTNVFKLSTSEMTIIAIQEDLLIKELETLKSMKRLLWLLLQTTECKHLSSKNIDTLVQKLSENETQNTNLRREMLERENHVKELSSRLQLEKVNVLKADHMTRSVKAVQTHLQRQIRKKEVENDELKVKIQTLEKKIAEWKLQAGECKHQILSLRQKSEQKKTALKKANRSQKKKAERFETVVENITSRIREREVELSEILSTSNVWKKQHDKMVEEKTMLEIQREDLKKQITSLLEDLKKKEECRRNSNEEILAKLSSINSENENINLENEKLEASLAVLKTSSVSVETELLDLQEKAKLQKNLVEQYKNQVQKLQTEAEEQKSRYETVLNENKTITETKCLEVDKVRSKMEADLNELEHVRDLLKAAEEKLQEYQEDLMSCQRIHAQKCKTLRELQVQEEDNIAFLGSHSLEEENYNIQKKYEDLKRQLEKMEFQNEEFANQLAKQDESLQCSKLQLTEKTAECDGLARQLESALEDGRKMVSEEMERISYKQQALQTKMLVLETELRKREEEKKQLLCMFYHNEKHQEVCLKELENSLQKSENKTQSMQNYLEFLKASYVTMFG